MLLRLFRVSIGMYLIKDDIANGLDPLLLRSAKKQNLQAGRHSDEDSAVLHIDPEHASLSQDMLFVHWQGAAEANRM